MSCIHFLLFPWRLVRIDQLALINSWYTIKITVPSPVDFPLLHDLVRLVTILVGIERGGLLVQTQALCGHEVGLTALVVSLEGKLSLLLIC